MSHLSYTKTYRGVADVFLRDADLYAPLLHFIENVMTRESELTKAEREMIAAHVSKRNGCGFCLGAHRWTLAAMEVGWSTIEALEDEADNGAIDDRLRAVLRFAEKLTDTPERIDQSNIDDLIVAGWSEQAVEDAINVIALFNYVNRLVDAIGIDGDEDYFRQIGSALATRGYAPLIDAAVKRTQQSEGGQAA